MRKLFSLQRSGYYLVEETEEIDEFIVSNNLLATFGRPQLQHTISLNCYLDIPQI